MFKPPQLRVSIARATATSRPYANRTCPFHAWQKTEVRLLRTRRPTHDAKEKGSHQRRNAGSFVGNVRKLLRDQPFSFSLAIATIVFGAGMLVAVNYIYWKYMVGALHNYPEPVAQKLRRALYYTTEDVQPKDAIKYYKQAIQVAEEVGMDAFSDEVIGIKLAVASLMEELEQYTKAIQVLEIIRRDCLEKIEALGAGEDDRKNRTRLLGKATSIAIRLGELYSRPEIWDREAAEERLVWAVETILTERERRNSHNITDENEGPWMSNDQIGAALESLAHSYEAKDQHYLATPLFLQALSFHPVRNCHSVVLMNNLASSLAQQSPRAARAAQAYAESQSISERPSGPPATRETMIDNARAWAQKALEVAATITPPERTEECDVGCAVALHNLGELAEMSESFEEARKRYQEAVSLARAIDFQDGQENSSARLRTLQGAR